MTLHSSFIFATESSEELLSWLDKLAGQIGGDKTTPYRRIPAFDDMTRASEMTPYARIPNLNTIQEPLPDFSGEMNQPKAMLRKSRSFGRSGSVDMIDNPNIDPSSHYTKIPRLHSSADELWTDDDSKILEEMTRDDLSKSEQSFVLHNQ